MSSPDEPLVGCAPRTGSGVFAARDRERRRLVSTGGEATAARAGVPHAARWFELCAVELWPGRAGDGARRLWSELLESRIARDDAHLPGHVAWPRRDGFAAHGTRG